MDIFYTESIVYFFSDAVSTYEDIQCLTRRNDDHEWWGGKDLEKLRELGETSALPVNSVRLVMAIFIHMLSSTLRTPSGVLMTSKGKVVPVPKNHAL
jgi:hypothetical protein